MRLQRALLHIAYMMRHVRHGRRPALRLFIKCVVPFGRKPMNRLHVCSVNAQGAHTSSAFTQTLMRMNTFAARSLPACVRVPLCMCVCSTRFVCFCENTDLSKTSLGRLFYLVRVCIVRSLYWASCNDDDVDDRRERQRPRQHRSALVATTTATQLNSAFFVGSCFFSVENSFCSCLSSCVVLNFNETMNRAAPRVVFSKMEFFNIYIFFYSVKRRENEKEAHSQNDGFGKNARTIRIECIDEYSIYTLYLPLLRLYSLRHNAYRSNVQLRVGRIRIFLTALSVQRCRFQVTAMSTAIYIC